MNKTTLILACLSLVALGACTKETTCIARAANGDKLYEVEGSDACNKQINSEQGEYCDCDDQE